MMNRLPRALSCLVFVLIPLAASAQAPRPAATIPPHVVTLLAEIKAADADLLAVSEEDGRFLRVLAVTSGARHALEIGGASGYSAIWIGLGAARDRRPSHHHRVRSEARRGCGGQHPPRRPGRHRDGGPRRRVQGDSRSSPATSTSCSSTPGSGTTSGFSSWCSHGFRRAACFSRTTSSTRRPKCVTSSPRFEDNPALVDDDRQAVGRRNVGLGESQTVVMVRS